MDKEPFYYVVWRFNKKLRHREHFKVAEITRKLVLKKQHLRFYFTKRFEILPSKLQLCGLIIIGSIYISYLIRNSRILDEFFKNHFGDIF